MEYEHSSNSKICTIQLKDLLVSEISDQDYLNFCKIMQLTDTRKDRLWLSALDTIKSTV